LLLLIASLAFLPKAKMKFVLGSQEAFLQQKIVAKAKAFLFSIHDDENTAIEAYHALSPNIAFSLYELKQTGSRNLRLGWGNKIYEFDPNRCFTVKGIQTDLKKKHGENYLTDLVKPIANFGDSLFKAINADNPSKYIVAIHNNTDDAKGKKLSINTYKNSDVTKLLHAEPSMDEDDFFLVTEAIDFEFLKSKKQNVVLQSETCEDDGSLSVFCQQRKIPYINIEAQVGHKQQQKQMMLVCYELLNSR
jgi:hypothetical protein